MAAISQLISNLVISRMLDTDTGFNYWISQLAGGTEYPGIDVFQLLVDSDTQTLINGAVDEPQIDDAGLFAIYPACVVRTVSGNSDSLKLTPTLYSGSVIAWVDLYSTIEQQDIYKALSESYHDMFLDAMTETFNREDEFYLYQGGIGYNNDMTWSRGPLAKGGVSYRQKSRFAMSFNLPSVVGR